jgi:hypothetical protein
MSAQTWGGLFVGVLGAVLGGVAGTVTGVFLAESLDANDEDKLTIALLGAGAGSVIGSGVSGALLGSRINTLMLQQQNGGQT